MNAAFIGIFSAAQQFAGARLDRGEVEQAQVVPVVLVAGDAFVVVDAVAAAVQDELDPDAGGPGMRDWLQDIGHRDGLAAAFDTRVNGLAVLTGRASRRIARLLKRHGYRLIAAPQGFLVCSHGTLLDGEASWARRWGMTLGAASKTHVQNAPEGASK